MVYPRQGIILNKPILIPSKARIIRRIGKNISTNLRKTSSNLIRASRQIILKFPINLLSLRMISKHQTKRIRKGIIVNRKCFRFSQRSKANKITRSRGSKPLCKFNFFCFFPPVQEIVNLNPPHLDLLSNHLEMEWLQTNPQFF